MGIYICVMVLSANNPCLFRSFYYFHMSLEELRVIICLFKY